MKAEDFIGEPCNCGECVQAGVQDLPLKRDPDTGRWLHGYPLRRVYEAQQQFWNQFKTLAQGKAMTSKARNV